MTAEHPTVSRLRDRVRAEVIGEILELLTGQTGVLDMMAPWRQPTDPDEILPQILAARCLGIQMYDPGPRLPADRCRPCWGERYVWYGNCWGLQHTGDGLAGCRHACHDNEVYLA